MLENLGGRKLVGAAIIIVVALIAMVLKGDVPPNLLTLLEFLYGAFVVGNGVSKAVAASKDGVAAASQTEVNLEPIINDLHALKDADAQIAQSVSLVQQSLSLIIRKYGIDQT